jgi:hypothetical protein
MDWPMCPSCEWLRDDAVWRSVTTECVRSEGPVSIIGVTMMKR